MCPVRQKEQALSNESDPFLLERIAGGDEEATAVLIARYLGVIQKIAARFCAVGIEREDFVQEGLIALLCAIRTYSSEKGCSFNTYVRVCALNRMKTAAERVQTGRYTAVSNAVGLEQAENLPSDRRENPEELVIAQETLDWYANEVGGLLSERERGVFLLYLEGYEPAQIAYMLEVSAKAVYNALGRVRKKLKQAYSKREW